MIQPKQEVEERQRRNRIVKCLTTATQYHDNHIDLSEYFKQV